METHLVDATLFISPLLAAQFIVQGDTTYTGYKAQWINKKGRYSILQV